MVFFENFDVLDTLRRILANFHFSNKFQYVIH